MALWAGAVIQEIPDLVQWLYNAPKKGVYVSAVSDGSPCQRYRLPGSCVILEVDGECGEKKTRLDVWGLGFWCPWVLEIGNWKLESGKWELDIGHWTFKI